MHQHYPIYTCNYTTGNKVFFTWTPGIRWGLMSSTMGSTSCRAASSLTICEQVLNQAYTHKHYTDKYLEKGPLGGEGF